MVKHFISPVDRVLIVEDELLMQELLELYVKKAGFEPKVAGDGKTALRLLQSNPHAYAAVLLDRMLPDMEGLEVLEQIKQDEDLCLLPVILATAKDSQTEIIEGLKAGAKHYLPKPVDSELLICVLNSAVSDYRRYRALQTDVRQHGTLFRLLQEGRFRFQTLLHAQSLAVALAEHFPHPQQAILGLSELLTNAVEHGNLEIGYTEKSRLLAADTWIEEIDQRLEDERFSSRYVEVEFKRTETEVTVQICDQGPGFDWQSYLEIGAERVFDRHGRGIALAGEMSFDKIQYTGSGNEVICSVALD